MTIICMVCKPSKPGPKSGSVGRSRVVLTRKKVCRVLGTRTRTTQRRSITIVRTRECMACRYRWKTYELPYPVRSARAARKRMKARAETQ